VGDRHVRGGAGLEALRLAADLLLDLAIDGGALVVGGDLDGDGGQRGDGQRD
jgi:hypothetical protein